ncbi:MAG: hypothetical protein RMJ43_12260 [Chloroherpetonaceae bacterium]|nr:hypothetical protein [Chthonomonadaceae bacterium]MDW8208601.1 hypothetical protein [Chloroherpetonaceae bacterium]
MQRLTMLHINLIGVGTAIVLAIALYFALIKPKNEELEQTRASVEQTRSAGGTQQQVSTKQRELEQTKQQVAKTKAEWAVNEVKYMPPPSVLDFGTQDDLLLTYQNKIIKLPAYFGERLSAWYDAQRPLISRLPGVEFPIDAFPTDPNAISQLTSLKFPRDRWQVVVSAKYFDAAMEHLRRFNDMRGLGMPVINNVALQGNSPDLLVSYDLALYVIPREAPPPSDPRLTGRPGTATAPGAAGAMGGAPGMPTMMPGGGLPGAPTMPGGGPASYGGGGGPSRKDSEY